jgi:eukaryotic-like serine/threonine-protein kinase
MSRTLPPSPSQDESLGSDTDLGPVTEGLVTEETVIVHEERVDPAAVTVPVPPPPGVGPVEDEVGAKVVSEDEVVGVGVDGTVRRHYERVEQEAVRRRRSPSLGWAFFVLALLVLAGLLAWWYFSRADTKQVPAVTGLPVATAVNQLQNQGFKTGITTLAHPQAAGIVFAQSPNGGADAKDGSTVAIEVSKGPATVLVPNAVGLDEATARTNLAAAGLEVRTVKVFAQEHAGTVIAQNPVAGGTVSRGSSVQINVSQGTGLVIVPNVVGESVGDAQTQLAQAGVNGAIIGHVPSSQPVGTVVSQNPAGGNARRGSNVELNVSRGTA